MAVTSVTAQERARMQRNLAPTPAASLGPAYPDGNLLAPYSHFVDTGSRDMLSVAFVGPSGWTLDPGDGSAAITLADTPTTHTYTAPSGPVGAQVAVVARLFDTGSTLRGQLAFAIPRPCHYPRQVAACLIGRVDDYPPIAGATTARARSASG
jgi:hypothetical protein